MTTKLKTVLIVDDDESLREIFSISLEMAGYQTIAAKNGKAALDVLLSLTAESLPDCILLDYFMPEMDGPTFLETLRTRYAVPFENIPIIICSAFASIPRSRFAFNRLEKPFDLEKLYRTINSTIMAPPSSVLG